MKTLLTVSAVMTVSLFIFGCHFFEDADNVDECPLNSGYPCPCDSTQLTVYCDDGRSACMYWNDPTRGFCSLPCDGASDTQKCANTAAYGNEGICRFMADGSTTPNYCGVVCQGNGGGNCPPGMDCMTLDGEDYKVCFPRETK
jgi:hypothetical protein